MAAFYNEYDPKAATWLRELIRAGVIADGEVDERSIIDIRPVDLRGFTQCHFFAGIGGWSCALRLAGWPDDRPVWTGSPPCQPFSTAGRQIGRDDARHLGPHLVGLVRACRPPVLFGEQVASAAVFGPAAKGNRPGFEGTPPWAWVDDLFDRLEAAHYAAWASDIPAAGIGAPHIRQRTFFGAVRLADAERDGPAAWLSETAGRHGGIADVAGDSGHRQSGPGAGQSGDGRVDNTAGARHHGPVAGPEGNPRDEARLRVSGQGRADGGPHASDFPWRTADWLFCRDGKWRPVEPGTFPLAHGVSARVGRLRGYGNAIVPQAAAAFIQASMKVVS